MLLRTAKRAPFTGEQFWGCSTFPKCRARIGLSGEAGVADAAQESTAEAPVAGGSAQARFDRLRTQRRERIKKAWPFLVGITVVVMVLAYLTVQSLASPAWGAAAAAGVALIFALTAVEMPQSATAWRQGAEGERKTADYLKGLEQAGFVVFHDRKVPGYGGNLDHVAIGPSGIWAIETKSLRGKVEIDADKLSIGGRAQDKIIDQVYREAVAVQVALSTKRPDLATSVIPVICLHRGELPWFNKTVRGVRLASGRQLVRLLKSGEQKLTDEEIQSVAAAAAAILARA